MRRTLFGLSILLLIFSGAGAQVTKIIATDEVHGIGHSVANLGDLDGDGYADIAVGGDLGEAISTVHILFLNRDGTVKSNQPINAYSGVPNTGSFGRSLCNIGDLNGDGRPELAVGAKDAVYIVYLNSDGTASGYQTIARRVGGLGDNVVAGAGFGRNLAGLGDLNGDGLLELVVAAAQYGTGDDRVLYLLSLNSDGTVARILRTFTLDAIGAFRGFSVSTLASLPDLDGDGISELLIGDIPDAHPRGSFNIAFLDEYGKIKRMKRIGQNESGFSGELGLSAKFGTSATILDDIDGDGIVDMAVGAPGTQDDSDWNAGAAWILYLDPHGTVENELEISNVKGTFPYLLEGESERFAIGDRFGTSMTAIDDLDGDGVRDLVVGAPGDDDGGEDSGALYVIFSTNLPQRSDLKLSAVDVRPERPRAGEEVEIYVNTPGTEDLAELTLWFRWGGYPGPFLGVQMGNAGEGLYTASIPSPLIGERGIDYYVSGESGDRKGRMPKEGIASVPIYVEAGLFLSLNGGIREDAYRLYSVPLSLGETSARTTFESQLGLYDVSQWRLFSVGESQRLVELNEQDLALIPGQAYWILTRERNRVINTGSGTTVPTDRPYQVRLTRGVNLVGNPFAFAVPVSNLSTSSGQPVEIYSYDGAWNAAVEEVLPFEGYVVVRDKNDTLLIDPDLTPSNVQANRASLDPRPWSPEHVLQLESLFPFTSRGNAESQLKPEPHPNPFSDSITIEYELKETTTVTLEIYDVLGRNVATLVDGSTSSGLHAVVWDGRSATGSTLADGTYLYRLRAGGFERTGTIVKVP